MAGDFDLDLDDDQIARLEYAAEMYGLAQDVGDRVAAAAAANAPRDTPSRGGAASIHAEVGTDEESVYADVSWDKPHFYMYFAEVGTEKQTARPFLRPALDSTRI